MTKKTQPQVVDNLLHHPAPESVLREIVEVWAQLVEHTQSQHIIALLEDLLHHVVPKNVLRYLRTHALQTSHDQLLLLGTTSLQRLLQLP
jgi:hypothetical protein